jgi:transposase
MKFVNPLKETEVETLQAMHGYHPSRRARMRAHCLLLSHQQYQINEIARFYQVSRRRVSTWINRWHDWGLAGLYDQPRHGRPPIYSEPEQEQIDEYLQRYPQDVKRIVEDMAQKTHKRVSAKTMKRYIKKKDHVWKRIKKTTEKAPDPVKCQRRKQVIENLHHRDDQGECDLWYFDGAGFCLAPCVPYAWQPIGDYIKVPTSSHGQRLNVLGFLKRDNSIVPYMIEGSVDSKAIIESFDQFSDQIEKRTYVLIDNAPMHRAKAFIQQIPKWVKKGLIVKYLPSYSPELNLIEILWRFIKYYWLPFSAYASFQSLVAAVEDILNRFGTDYRIAFKTA